MWVSTVKVAAHYKLTKFAKHGHLHCVSTAQINSHCCRAFSMSLRANYWLSRWIGRKVTPGWPADWPSSITLVYSRARSICSPSLARRNWTNLELKLGTRWKVPTHKITPLFPVRTRPNGSPSQWKFTYCNICVDWCIELSFWWSERVRNRRKSFVQRGHSSHRTYLLLHVDSPVLHQITEANCSERLP